MNRFVTLTSIHLARAPVLAVALMAFPALGDPGTALVREPAMLEVGGKQWSLFGIRGLAPDATCVRDGAPFDCADHATEVLARFIGGRRVVCEPRGAEAEGAVPGVCSAGGEDIGAWLVRQGWAFADARVSVNYIVDENYARMRQVGLWRPGTELR